MKPLSLRASNALNAARALSAVYVVLHHTVQLSGWVGGLFSFGQEAVIVFFMLSGFVIWATESNSKDGTARYFLKRIRRIYPAFLAAILLSLALGYFGLISETFDGFELAANLFGLQDISSLKPGQVARPFMGNAPLWSLGYEMFFYLTFPVILHYFRRHESRTRMLVAVGSVLAFASYLVFPNHFSLVASYFLIWWIGAMLAKAHLESSMKIQLLKTEMIGLTSLICLALIGLWHFGFSGLGQFPFLMLRHFSACAVFLIVCVSWFRRPIAMAFTLWPKVTNFVASISYGLYIFHYPLLVQTSADTTLWVIPAAVALLLVAWIGDRLLLKIIPRIARVERH